MDRVILVPGPAPEIEVVNQMYRWFTDDGQTETEIAVRLNEKGVRTDLDRNWTPSTVREVLTNEKYIGNNVYNRRSFGHGTQGSIHGRASSSDFNTLVFQPFGRCPHLRGNRACK